MDPITFISLLYKITIFSPQINTNIDVNEINVIGSIYKSCKQYAKFYVPTFNELMRPLKDATTLNAVIFPVPGFSSD